MVNIKSRYLENFAIHTFDIKNLPNIVSEKLEDFFIRNIPIDNEIAELVALEMKRWAVSMGCTHYTHWFQPLTGLTAEKHNTFLQTSSFQKRSIIEDFSASELIQGEPDASSFPHGGIRSTFEARGYTVWDPSSPSFIMESDSSKTLFIPSIFISYTGDVLDKKTPLLRSIKCLSDICCKLLRLFGINTNFASPLIGPEQEYFLIPREYTSKRLDLNIMGYSLFGAKCPKGQKFQDHYFGSIKDEILSFMNDTEETLIKLGIPIKTRHNEVAPNQFEIAVLPEYANIASDHNQLLMEVLKRSASKYNLNILFHEKPFFGVNGSGKHINWSIVLDDDCNLFDLSPDKYKAVISLLFISALIRGINKYSDLLRAIFACSGNDRRLGGNEAPPCIISLYTGEELKDIFENIENLIKDPKNLIIKENAEIDGLRYLPYIKKDNTDRNRTAPIAFTGNKFEFRMTGSSQSIAFPITVINLIMAESLDLIYIRMKKALEDGKDIHNIAIELIKENYKENKDIIYNGNTYSSEWYQEAERRKLFIADSTPYAIDPLLMDKNIQLFTKYKILKEDEVNARYIIKQNIYIDTIETEIRIARDMIRTKIIPSIFKYQKQLSDSIASASQVITDKEIFDNQRNYLEKLSKKLSDLIKIVKKLDIINENIKNMDQKEKAYYLASDVSQCLDSARELISKLEERTDYEIWPLTRYSDMFFGSVQ